MKISLWSFSYSAILIALCAVVFLTPIFFVEALTEEEIVIQEQKLRNEYDELQEEIAKWQGILDDTRKKANSIQGDISVLNAKIKEAELTIKAKNIAISQISSEINNKNKKINELENRIEKGKESISQLMRKTNELDSYSLVEVILAQKDISEFFKDIDFFTSIKKSMKEHFAVVREAKANTEEEKEQLDIRKNQEADAKYVVETRKKTIAQSEAEKKKLLAVTKTEEQSYQMVLSERQKRAAQIRAALFRLRDSEGIAFGQALEYATFAGQKTGIRPALILAILTQESDLGKNQGSCLLTDLVTGNGVGKNTGTPFDQIMKAPRDTVPFGSITSRLNRDWQMTPVSCPPGQKYYVGRGFGGGMGPAQFIPSTWELFKSRIASAVGVKPDEADPWDPQHSFVATSIYLSDLGAVNGSFTAERNAACRYYSGEACRPGRVPSNVFYGDQVMAKVEEIQNNIDFLKDI